MSDVAWRSDGGSDLRAEIHGRSYRIRRIDFDDGDDPLHEVAELSRGGRWHVGRLLKDLAAAKAEAETRALHHVEHVRLARATVREAEEEVTTLAEGVVFRVKGNDRAIFLSSGRNAAMPAALRLDDSRYDGDVQWARVATGFPSLFTTHERERAARTLEAFLPDVHAARENFAEHTPTKL